jgi:diguanylate cyclase (GGDEF)-like protein
MTATRLSITNWVAAFFLTLGLVLALVCGIGLYRLYKLDADIHQTRLGMARLELASAVRDLVSYVEHQGNAIASWDETRQQLINPSYYGYWKTSRVQQAGMVPRVFSNLDLYDSAGQILPGGNSNGDAQLAPADTGKILYYPSKGLNQLAHFFPLYSDEGQKFILGYARMDFDFVQALKLVRSFTYLRPDTLKVNHSSAQTIPLQDLPQHLGFEITPSQEIDSLEMAVKRTYAMLALAMFIAAVTAYIFVQRLLARPLAELADVISNLQADDSHPDYVEQLEEPYLLRELDTVRQSIHDYRMKLSDARLALENSNITFQQQALQDSLTGLYNRRAFEDDWEKLVSALGGQEQPMALLLFDCDHFKPINDTYGHQVGDLVLQTIAGAVNEVMRSGDRLYRIGGDEFATLLWGADEETAKQIAERCQDSVRKEDFRRLGVLEPVTISIGIAIDEISHPDDITRLQAHADAAMYLAKRPGHKKIAVYRKGEAIDEDVLVASLETTALYQALAEPEKMEIHFQRMQPLAGGQEYMEALTRIRHNDILLTPDRFLPVVNSRRLEAEFDLAVIRLIQGSIESGAVPPRTGVSINLSAQSLHRPEIIAQLIDLTKHAERHPLILEITETTLVPQLAEITHFLGILRSSGFKVALDDFGSGYSPLRYLADLPVDIIKFDMGLIHQLKNNDRASMVVADFARLMRDAGYDLVAEGVEDEALLHKVRSLGFSHVQGFHIDVPHVLLPPEDKVVKLFN